MESFWKGRVVNPVPAHKQDGEALREDEGHLYAVGAEVETLSFILRVRR